MIVLICGLSGSGKSEIAERVGKKLGLKVVHTSGVLKQLREKKAAQIKLEKAEKNVGFYESEEGQKFMQERLANESFDRELDQALLALIDREKNLVLDSWTMPWLSKKGVKVWLEVSDKVRAQRIAGRDKISAKEALAKAQEKEEQTGKLFKKLYGFDFGKNLSVFDFKLKTDKLSLDQVVEKVVEFLQKKKV
jgi:cytidylate kinase